MDGGDWALVIAALFWGVLVLAIVSVLYKVGKRLDEVGSAIRGVTDEALPILSNVNETISGVNVELARVDTIIAGVQSITATADQLVGVVHATVSNPMIKVAAWVTGALAATRSAKALKDEV